MEKEKELGRKDGEENIGKRWEEGRRGEVGSRNGKG
jgi:hypothetical protein